MKNKNLVITESITDEKCLMVAIGSIDSKSADELLHSLENALENGKKTGQKNIVLDMSGVEYLNSIGIRVLLKIYKRVSATGGQFNIAHPSEVVKNVLGMVALNEMLVTN